MPLSGPHPSSPRARRALAAVVTILLSAAAVVLSGSAADARPGQQQPTIADVTATLARLSKQNEQLDERYNVAVAAVAAQRKVAEAAQRAAESAAAASAQAHERLDQAASQQYEAGAMNSTGLLLTSANPQSYLDDLSTMDYLSRRLAAVSTQAEAAQATAHAAAQHAAAALSSARAKARAVRAHRATLIKQTAKFKQLLATLTEQQRRAYARARAVAAAQQAAAQRAAAAASAAAQQNPPAQPSAPSAPKPPAPAPSAPGSAVQRVVDYAKAQVGKAYVFAAAGPNAFDCSGLTMQAWAQAGVQLPHMASAQYNVGRHVSYSQLQPGDLIFLYNPIGHVEIYVGHDLAVSAADPALGVVYVHPSQDMADYVGATRPQG